MGALLRASRHRRDQALEAGRKVAVRDWFVVELALGSGLRVCELSALSCADLLLGDHPSVLVRQGKGGKARVVRVSSGLKAAAQRFLSWKRNHEEPLQDESPLLYSVTTSSALSKRSLQRSWRRSLAAAGLVHRGIHAARHTFATALLRSSKGNLRLVQQQLGHARLETTQIYLSVFTTDIEDAVEGLYSTIKHPTRNSKRHH